jgi:proteasome accessory factor A
MSALDIQREYLDKAIAYSERVGFPPLEQRALDMWRHCITSIETDPMLLDREVDWVIKRRLVESFCDRHAVDMGDPRVLMLDLQYHDLLRSRGVFYRMQERGLVERVCADADVETAMDTAPQTTRARLRGEFIKAAKEKKRDYTVDWVHLKLNDQAQRTVLCKDPFKSRDERVERLIATL